MSPLPQIAGYLAGMIDADGHVIFRTGRNSSPDVGVTNTSRELMTWLCTHVGGAFSLQRATCEPECESTHIHQRAVIFKWHVTGQRAVILLLAIRPYLVIKGDRADTVIAKYERHTSTMQRPARRRHHIAKETAAMTEKGWD